ncbi:MAG TPA: zf-HC2 domain-containing protein [Thermoanaerobaculia bacterium]|jgi:anti-sigma factor RsiW|nr:zf-HC2 domain-containing protein [Thermoanaerobaculia bacterium]
MEMETIGTREERQHRRICELIPWYVNGTLPAAERRGVDEHAAVCRRCQGELAAASEMARAIQSAEAAAPSPHPAQLARLLGRIDTHEAERTGTARPLGTGQALARPLYGFAALLDSTPRRMRHLLAAELAAVLALASILAWHLRTPTSPASPAPAAIYHTLSSDAPVTVAPGTVAIRVLFAEGATAARIQQILAGIRGQVTAGPSPLGAYVVAVPAGPGADPVELVLAHLRQQPEVSFAARVAGAGGT